MHSKLTVNVRPEDGPTGDMAIQRAIEQVAAQGGGTVQLGPGTYHLYNSIHLRDRVRIIGSGEDTSLFKEASTTIPLAEDSDWYEACVRVADARPFRVGGGVLLSGNCPHSGTQIIQIHTILAIEDNILHLDNRSRLHNPMHLGNFWVGHEATASTLFSFVAGNVVSEVEVGHLRVDGNCEYNTYLHGNYAGAFYFQDSTQVYLHHLYVENVNSDGLSFQIVNDLTIEDSIFENCIQGIHAGSGAQQPVIRRNTIRGMQSHGLVWCWGVKHGLAADNIIENCRSAISIGHRDTENVMRGNILRYCNTGLTYRDDPPHQAAHDNLIEGNLFEDIGTSEEPSYGIHMDAPVHGNVLRGNRFVCNQPDIMKAAIYIGPKVESVIVEENICAGLPCEVEDLRDH